MRDLLGVGVEGEPLSPNPDALTGQFEDAVSDLGDFLHFLWYEEGWLTWVHGEVVLAFDALVGEGDVLFLALVDSELGDGLDLRQNGGLALADVIVVKGLDSVLGELEGEQLGHGLRERILEKGDYHVLGQVHYHSTTLVANCVTSFYA